MIETEKYIRKPLYVDAVRVTNANFDEIAAWCQGEIEQDESGKGTSKQYIKVRVHNPKNPRQTKAFVGDWLLYTERGYKVYTNKAFHTSFDQVEGLAPKVETELPTRLGNVSLTPEEKDQCAVRELDEPLSEEEEAAIADTQPPEGQQFTTSSTEETAAIAAHEYEPVEEEPTEPPVEDTRKVISEEDQQAMDPDELRELLKTGEFVLAQDLAA